MGGARVCMGEGKALSLGALVDKGAGLRHGQGFLPGVAAVPDQHSSLKLGDLVPCAQLNLMVIITEGPQSGPVCSTLQSMFFAGNQPRHG